MATFRRSSKASGLGIIPPPNVTGPPRRSSWGGPSRTIYYFLRPVVVILVLFLISRWQFGASTPWSSEQSPLSHQPSEAAVPAMSATPLPPPEAPAESQSQEEAPPAQAQHPIAADEKPLSDEPPLEEHEQHEQHESHESHEQHEQHEPHHGAQWPAQKPAAAQAAPLQRPPTGEQAPAQKVPEHNAPAPEHHASEGQKKPPKKIIIVPPPSRKRPVPKPPRPVIPPLMVSAPRPPSPPPQPLRSPIKGGKALWQDFKFFTRFYGGLKSVGLKHEPESPQSNADPESKSSQSTANQGKLPEPRPDSAYAKAASSEQSKSSKIETCYLDEHDRIEVPKISAYEGTTRGFPEPAMGSYDLFDVNRNKCYDRYSRFGAYGYGYAAAKGGLGAGLDGDREGVDKSLPAKNQIDYRTIDWSAAQQRCIEKNRHRFPAPPPPTNEKWRKAAPSTKGAPPAPKGRVERTAVLVRVWDNFEWTHERILNARAMIAELSLLSGGEYEVFFLVHVRDHTVPIWSSDEIYESVLRNALPKEFVGMGVLWSEKQMELEYFGLTDTIFQKSNTYSNHRSGHLPVQHFAQAHPEFEYFWNWEADLRSTGHWHEMLESLRTFAKAQPRKGLWERNERFYIPSVHGTWEQFRDMVHNATGTPPLDAEDRVSATNIEPPVWGRRGPWAAPVFAEDPRPPRAPEQDQYEWGRGEEADLITLSPLFNPLKSGWIGTQDATGYRKTNTSPPRRASIVAAMRLSRRLLTAMHVETALYRHTMFTEMWAGSMALHHGFKAVYAPHPVFADRAWPAHQLDKTFNPGPNGEAGSAAASPFNYWNEHNFRGLSWYFNSAFPRNLWGRWWGFDIPAQDGEIPAHPEGEGRMCLPPMLLHPIKAFELVHRDHRE